jgi:hypothetical protein
MDAECFRDFFVVHESGMDAECFRDFFVVHESGIGPNANYQNVRFCAALRV